jgi:hypothetical protein
MQGPQYYLITTNQEPNQCPFLLYLKLCHILADAFYVAVPEENLAGKGIARPKLCPLWCWVQSAWQQRAVHLGVHSVGAASTPFVYQASVQTRQPGLRTANIGAVCTMVPTSDPSDLGWRTLMRRLLTSCRGFVPFQDSSDAGWQCIIEGLTPC